MRTGVVYGFTLQPRIKQMAADVQLIQKNVKQLYWSASRLHMGPGMCWYSQSFLFWVFTCRIICVYPAFKV